MLGVRVLPAVCLVAAFFVPSLLAQVQVSLSGRVTDASGAVVPGATIRATRTETGLDVTATSDSMGAFLIPSLAPGRYSIRVEKQGFQPVVRDSVQLAIGGSPTLDFELRVGDLANTVTVSGELAPVERDATSVSTVIDRRFVENMPLNGRSFQSLVQLAPGVVISEASVTSPGQFSVNGQRTNANYFLVDGIAANVGASAFATFSQQAAGTLPGLTVLGGTNSLVTVEGLQEFRIQTSTYSAEFGRSPGGQISLSSRSGGNAYHGSLFEDFRNEKLDANDWFFNQAGRGRSPLRLNQFGGSFGGPVWIPGVYSGKNRTFFFGDFEALRLRQPRLLRAQVPTAEARAQATGSVQTLLNAFPLPTGPRLSDVPTNANYLLALYESGYSDPAQHNIGAVRVDHMFSDKVSAFARLNFAPTQGLSRNFSSMLTTTEINTYTFTGGLNWTISPRVVSETRLNYSTSRGGFGWSGMSVDGAVPPPDNILFPNYANRDNASTNFSFGVFTGGLAPPNLTIGKSLFNGQRQWNLIENFTWVTGRHQLKFGGDLRWLRPSTDFRAYGISYNFGSVQNALRTGTANAQIQALAPPGDMTFPAYSLYINDTWRLAARLTLNLGLRWELIPSPEGTADRPIYNIDQTANLLTAQLAPTSRPVFDTRYNNFAPRVGIAWQPFASRGLTIRSGFGIFHDTGTGQVVRGFNSWPYNSLRTVPNVALPAAAGVLDPAPFNTAAPYASTFNFTDPELQQPYTWHWNFGLEQNLGSVGVVSATYVGSAGKELLYTEFLRNRPAVPAQGLPARTVINPAVFGESFVNLVSNRSRSNYNALQLQWWRRAARGLQTQLAYTWGKSLDDFSDEATQGIPAELFSRDLDYGRSFFDVRHTFTAAITYDIPSPFTGGFGKALLGGWSTDWFVRARSAPPVSPFTGTDPLNIGIVTVTRPDLVPGQPIYIDDPNAPAGKRLNPRAFANPPAGRQGTLGRNAIDAFGMQQFDAAVRRVFSFGERMRLTFRADFFNLANRPNFARPVADTRNTLFGLADRTLAQSLGAGNGAGFSPLFQVGGPRSIQLALRLAF